jgi:Tfp pilus assembly protein PilO
MKRLPKEKRNQLIIVAVSTIALIALVYIFLIKNQNDQNTKLAADTNAEQTKLDQVKKIIKQADATATTAQQISTLLDAAEEDTVTGDPAAWTYDTMRQFKVNRHVDIISMSQPIQLDEEMLPDFPYKQIKFQIIGSGYYHDIGKFIADLENRYPHIRVINLVIDPYGANDASPEKLSFRMEIEALIKPTF